MPPPGASRSAAGFSHIGTAIAGLNRLPDGLRTGRGPGLSVRARAPSWTMAAPGRRP